MLTCVDCNSTNIKEQNDGRFRCRDCGSRKIPVNVDKSLIDENGKLQKKLQRKTDQLRIKNKTTREDFRVVNALELFNMELIKTIGENSKAWKLKQHKETKQDRILLVQASDFHLNELINTKYNNFDFNVASVRLRYYAEKIKKYAKVTNVKKIVVMFLGDLINSDRRLDELLNMATNRANATYFGAMLIEQFLIDLNSVANIDVFSVTGNESRVKEEIGYSDLVASDNYDVTIQQMLKIAFRNKKGITIHEGSPKEQILNLFGRDYLLMHGEPLGSNTQAKVTQVIGKFSLQGYNVQHVFYGHLHSSYASDFFSRNSSLCGSNTYNENAMQLLGRAAQTIHILSSTGEMDSMKLDLQYATGEGYDISNATEAYHIKSSDKLKKNEVIMKVVI